jgi:SAM-dependent methyltransferase
VKPRSSPRPVRRESLDVAVAGQLFEVGDGDRMPDRSLSRWIRVAKPLGTGGQAGQGGGKPPRRIGRLHRSSRAGAAMTAAAPMAQSSRTESEIVAAQYHAWAYPQPVPDMAQAVAKGEYWDLSDPSLFRRKLWPRKIEPQDLTILIAGCGTNQAACYAVTNPNSKVVGLDLSEASLGHEAYLKHKHGLDNLELFRMTLGDVGSLGRTFDLIVCTGVLHHLPDPDAGLRCLRDVLRPHGVISVMVYGYYPRFGVYMMQEVFRMLALTQDAVGIGIVKRAIEDVPAWHHVRRYLAIAPDLGYDSGLVDTFLHGLDRAFTVPQVLEFASRNNLKFQSWLDNLDYSISASIMVSQNPLRQRVETLAPAEQWRIVELIAQSLATHRFLLCHPDKSEADYRLDFATDAWLDYVPSLRYPVRISNTAEREGTASDGDDSTATPWSSVMRRLRALPRAWRGSAEPAPAGFGPLTISRGWHSSTLTAFEGVLIEQVDGERPISQLITAAAQRRRQSLPEAREFFSRMADWDHLQFQIP